jgi:hypothetical protein
MSLSQSQFRLLAVKRSQIQGLTLLLLERFVLQLKDAISSELVENEDWRGKRDFNIDKVEYAFYTGHEMDSISEENWGEFLGAMCDRMGVPTDRGECMLALGEFEALLIDVLQEWPRKSSTGVDRE